MRPSQPKLCWLFFHSLHIGTPKCCCLFYSLLFALWSPLPSSQIQCPTLAWLISIQLFLNYFIPTTFCLWAFIFLLRLYILLLLLLHGWLGGWWLTPDVLLHSFSLAPSSSSLRVLLLFTICSPALSVLSLP